MQRARDGLAERSRSYTSATRSHAVRVLRLAEDVGKSQPLVVFAPDHGTIATDTFPYASALSWRAIVGSEPEL